MQCCVTSPPYYGLRDYGVSGQIGLEGTPELYVAKLVEVFGELRRVLKDDGVLWLNLGDSYVGSMKGMGSDGKAYGGSKQQSNRGSIGIGTPDWSKCDLKPKNLIGIPWRVAFALQKDGWILRSDVIWHKPNVMPESVKDRPTKAHEYLFLLSKSEKYFYDGDVIREPAVKGSANAGARNYRHRNDLRIHAGQTEQDVSSGRNRRSVWSVPTRPYKDAHFAVMPVALVEPCILAGSRAGDVILDVFAGSGTVCCVGLQYGRRYVGIELNADYVALAEQRLRDIKC